MKLLGNDFDFKDVAFAHVVDCDVLNLSCTEYVTSFAIDKDCPHDWHGRISIDGEDFKADIEMLHPIREDWSRRLCVLGKHDFQGKLVVFRLGKRAE